MQGAGTCLLKDSRARGFSPQGISRGCNHHAARFCGAAMLALLVSEQDLKSCGASPQMQAAEPGRAELEHPCGQQSAQQAASRET